MLGLLALLLSACGSTRSSTSPHVAPSFQLARDVDPLPQDQTTEFRFQGGEAWMRLALAQDGRYQLDTEGSDFDTVLALYDEQQGVVERNDDGGSGLTSLIERELQAGEWYLLLTGYQGKSGEAQVGVRYLSTANPSSAPTGIAVGGTQDAFLAAGAAVEFELSVTQAGTYRISTEGSQCDTVLEVWSASGTQLARDDDSGAGTTSLIERQLQPGDHRLRITGFSTTTSGAVRCAVRRVGGSSAVATAPGASSTQRGSSRLVALRLTLGQALDQQLSANSELWFQVTVPRRGAYEFLTEGSRFDTVLTLHDNSGRQLARDDDGGTGTTSYIARELDPGLWYLRLTGFGSNAGSARILARAGGGSAARTPNAGSSSSSNVVDLQLGSPARGRLSAGGTLEYRLVVTQEGQYEFLTEGSTFDTVLTLLNASRAQIVRDDDGGNGLSSRIVRRLQPATYFLRLQGYNNSVSGPSVLNARALSTSGPVASGARNGTSRPTALPIRVGQTQTTNVPAMGERWFELRLTAPAHLTFSTANSSFDTVLSLHDSAGVELQRDDDSGAGLTSELTRAIGTGLYFLKITPYGSSSGRAQLAVREAQQSGGNQGQAFPLQLGLVRQETLTPGQELWFQFQATTTGVYTFTTEGSRFDTVLELLSSTRSQIARDDDSGTGTSSLITRQLAAGSYFLVVKGYSPSASGRTRLLARSASRDGSTRALAIPLALGQSARRGLSSGGELWFQFETTATALMECATAGSNFDTILTLQDASGTQLARDDDGGPGTASLIRRTLARGTYYLRVTGFGQASGNVQLVVNSQSAGASPLAGGAGTPGLSSLTGSGSGQLRLNVPARGRLSSGAEASYEFEITTPGQYELTTEGSTFDTVLTLYDQNGRQIDRDDDSGPGLQSLIQAYLRSGRYRAVVSGYNTASGQMVLLLRTPGAVAVTSAALLTDGSRERVNFRAGDPRALVHYELEVTDAMQAVELRLAVSSGQARVYARHAAPLTNKDDADHEGRSRGDYASLLLRRGGSPPLRTGTYSVAVAPEDAAAALVDLEVKTWTGNQGIGRSPSRALPLALCEGLEQRLGPREEAWVQLDLTPSALTSLDTLGSDIPVRLTLYDANGAAQEWERRARRAGTRLELEDPAPGRYLVRLSSASEDAGQLVFHAQEGRVDEQLYVGEPLNLRLAGDQRSALYRVLVPEGARSLDASLRLTKGEADLVARWSTTERRASDARAGTIDRRAELLLHERTRPTLRAGTYYLSVERRGNSDAQGRLIVRQTTSAPRAGDSMTNSPTILAAEVEKGGALLPGAARWYRLQVVDEGELHLRTEGSQIQTELDLFANDGQHVGGDTNSGVGGYSLLSMELEPGAYFARVRSVDEDPGSYRFRWGRGKVARTIRGPETMRVRIGGDEEERKRTSVVLVEPGTSSLALEVFGVEGAGRLLVRYNEPARSASHAHYSVEFDGESAELRIDEKSDVPLRTGSWFVDVVGQGSEDLEARLSVRFSEERHRVVHGLELVALPREPHTLGLSDEGPGGIEQDDPDFQLIADEARREYAPSGAVWMGRYEVDQGVWEEVMGSLPDVRVVDARLPVTNVSWADAREFCDKLTNTPEARAAGLRFRLPNEDEWEFACRAATRTPVALAWRTADRRPFADRLEEMAWFQSHTLSGGVNPTGLLRPNAWGLYDMHGNVAEWCTPSDSLPELDAGQAPLRGGGYNSLYAACRASNRDRVPASMRNGATGFRVVAEAR